MMILAVLLSAVTAGCSGDSDDGSLPDNVVSKTAGVHKIEISMEGDYAAFSPKAVFNAFKRNGVYANTIDEGGKSHTPLYDADYKGGKLIAWTEGGCIEFACSILFINAGGKAGKVTVRCTGYVDGTKTLSDSRTIEFSGGDTSKAAHFNSIDGFTDF